MRSIIIYILLLSSFLILHNGCSTLVQLNKDDGLNRVAGVDSLTRAFADSIAQKLFISETRKLKAQSLFEKASKRFNIADSLWKIYNAMEIDSTDTVQVEVVEEKQRLYSRIIEKIIVCENWLDKAVKLNSFDINIKSMLADVFSFHGHVVNEPAFFEKSTEILRNILLYEKGEHILYYRLGENLYELKQWQEAFNNYKQAEKVLLQTAFLNRNNNRYSKADSVDRNLHFRYLYYQAIAVAKLYDTNQSLALFQFARKIAPTDNEKKLVDNYIDWIQWDGGNIATAEKKSALINLLKAKKYSQAKSGFERLIKELNTQNAKDEISWRIALIEYEYLDQKEKACQRLYHIVQNTPVDQATKLPIDSEYRRYFKDAGTMFYKLGVEYKKKSKYKNAFQCFEKASQIQWTSKGRSLLELAKLSIHDPDKTLEVVNSILADDNHNLSIREQREVLTLKLNALKRFGRTRLTEIKHTFLEIRALQNN